MQSDFTPIIIAQLTTIEHFLAKVLSEQTKQPFEKIHKEMDEFREMTYETFMKRFSTEQNISPH